MASGKLILRAVKAAESARVQSAYDKWGDGYVLPRPEADYRAAAEKGLFFVIEENNDIVAATGVYDLVEGSKVETGSTYVDTPFRGYGIQQLFFQVRIANVVATQGPNVEITTAVNPENSHSLQNAQRAGFVSMLPIPEQIAPCVSCPKKAGLPFARACCCDFWTLTIDKRRAVVQGLLDRGVSIQLSCKAGTTLTVELQGRIFTDPDTRSALRDFAEGRDW